MSWRSSWLGAAARRLVFRLVVGDRWPPTLRAVASSEALTAIGSTNVYVHLPFCASRCPHCPYTAFVAAPATRAAYGEALRRELAAYLARNDVPQVTSLYFGGGTPSLTPELIEDVVRQVGPRLDAHAEVGVEVHPRDASAALLSRLRDAGVTRVSLGIETLDPTLLRLLGRRYTPDEALAAIATARHSGFECVDVNLIFGIPGQASESAAADAARCAELGVDQISAYPLFSFPYTPLGRAIADGRIRPAADRTRLAAQRRVSATCRTHDLARSSVWSFTRPGVAPYSTVTRSDYVGFGVGAGTSVEGELRFNTFSLEAYLASGPHRAALRLVPSDRFRRAHWVYWQIYQTRVDPRRYRERFGRDLDRDLGLPLAALRVLGLARRDADGVWTLTERGAIWVHRGQALFSLAYIDELWTRARDDPWPATVELR